MHRAQVRIPNTVMPDIRGTGVTMVVWSLAAAGKAATVPGIGGQATKGAIGEDTGQADLKRDTLAVAIRHHTSLPAGRRHMSRKAMAEDVGADPRGLTLAADRGLILHRNGRPCPQALDPGIDPGPPLQGSVAACDCLFSRWRCCGGAGLDMTVRARGVTMAADVNLVGGWHDSILCRSVPGRSHPAARAGSPATAR